MNATKRRVFGGQSVLTQINEYLHRTALALAFFVLHCASPVGAMPLASEDVQRLAAGETIIRVEPADSPADGHVTAAIDIAAPVARVWQILFECANAPLILPNLTFCGVLEIGPGHAWDVREHRVRWLSMMPEIRSKFRSEYVVGQSIRFTRVGGDMRALDGEWRLTPLAGGRATQLTYDATVGFGALIPSFMIRNSLEKDVPGFLAAIRSAALAEPGPLKASQ